MFEVGRVCVKTAGREAGKVCCVVRKMDAGFVMVTGPLEVSRVRRRKCSIQHLEALQDMVTIPADASDPDVIRAYQEGGILQKYGLSVPSAEELARAREMRTEKEKAKKEREEKERREREVLERKRKEEEARKAAEREKLEEKKAKEKAKGQKAAAKKEGKPAAAGAEKALGKPPEAATPGKEEKVTAPEAKEPEKK